MSRRAERIATALAGLLATAALGGCVSLPTGGQVPAVTRQLAASGELSQQGIQVVPRPPGPGWNASDIVQGFIAASGSSFPGVAKEYLDAKFKASWKPYQEVPTVLDGALKANPVTLPAHINGGFGVAQVNVTSQQVERLQSTGNIIVSSPAPVFRFNLIRVAGSWRIDGIFAGDRNTPQPHLLLLAESDFVRTFQARDLYFFACGTKRELVPDPVFIDESEGPAQAATALAQRLTPASNPESGQPASNPELGLAGCLQNQATWTAFPAGTTIGVSVQGLTATVSLGGAAAKASQARLSQMAEQLVWTLTSTSYSASPGIQSVSITVNRHGGSQAASGPPQLEDPNLVPTEASLVRDGPVPLFFQAGAGSAAATGSGLDVWNGQAVTPATFPSKLRNDGPFTAIAVSSGQEYFAGCRGRNVYIVGARLPVVKQTIPVSCTSLSWDGNGTLWVPAGHEILMLPSSCSAGGAGCQIEVDIPEHLQAGTVTSLQVAPDGVRVAMVVRNYQGKGGSAVVVAEISKTPTLHYLAQGQNSKLVTVGSDLANPIALTWWDPDHLLVLTQAGNATPQLNVVPLNGEPSSQPETVLPSRYVGSLTADWPNVVVGPAANVPPTRQRIWLSRIASDGPWRFIAKGTLPSYFG